MEKRFCDRCKEECEAYSVGYECTNHFPNQFFDLCEKCSNEFQIWFKEVKR